MSQNNVPTFNDEEVRLIVIGVGNRFRTFGGGRTSEFNPVANALKDKPLQFAAGVDVEEVVRYILQECLPALDRLESTGA